MSMELAGGVTHSSEYEKHVLISFKTRDQRCSWVKAKLSVEKENHDTAKDSGMIEGEELKPFFEYDNLQDPDPVLMGRNVYLIGGDNESACPAYLYIPFDRTQKFASAEEKKKALDAHRKKSKEDARKFRTHVSEFLKTYDPMLNTVRVFDALSSNPELSAVSPMNRSRLGSVRVPFKGKLYVFGGIQTPDIFNGDPDIPAMDWKNWGEVYDPESNKWTPLSTPPTKVDCLDYYHFSAAPIEDMDCIFLIDWDLNALCYHPGDYRWEEINIPEAKPIKYEHCFPGRWNCVVSDGIVYWYNRQTGALFAFDPMANTVLSTPLVELQKEPASYEEVFYSNSGGCTVSSPIILHLDGGLFCFLMEDKKHLHVNNFFVENVVEEGPLRATFGSSLYFPKPEGFRRISSATVMCLTKDLNQIFLQKSCKSHWCLFFGFQISMSLISYKIPTLVPMCFGMLTTWLLHFLRWVTRSGFSLLCCAS